VAQDLSEGAGGDSWVRALDVVAGERYVLYAMNFSISGVPFDLTWQFQDGAALECLELPAVAFWQSASSMFAGETVSYSDVSSGYPFAWWWEFQGGTPATSLASAPQDIIYELPGCFDVALTVYNAAGESTVVETCQLYVETTTGLREQSAQDFTLPQIVGALRIVPSRTGSYTFCMLDGTGRLVRSL